MIQVTTLSMKPTITIDGVELAQLRAICRRVANDPAKDPLSDIAAGFVHLINGTCEIAQVEVPVHE